jgi:hypothetical protein
VKKTEIVDVSNPEPETTGRGVRYARVHGGRAGASPFSSEVAREKGLHQAGQCFSGRDQYRGIIAGEIRKLPRKRRSDPEQHLIYDNYYN